MKIRFIGVGSQFSSHDLCQSNMVISAASGKRLLIDCGGDARFSMAESGIQPLDLDGVYISHLHADHVGGMEWLALSTYFSKEPCRLQLFGEQDMLRRLWENTMRGGLECIGKRCMTLADYFDCRPVEEGTRFNWEGIIFQTVKMRHIVGADCSHDSYGLVMQSEHSGGKSIFLSTDAIFQPELLQDIAARVDLIFHDCETSALRTNVHAHYEQLLTLPAAIRQKTWLYHYQAQPDYRPVADGFQGFVAKGQEFDF